MYQDLQTLKLELFEDEPDVAFAYFQVVLEEYQQEGTVRWHDVQWALWGWLECLGVIKASKQQKKQPIR